MTSTAAYKIGQTIAFDTPANETVAIVEDVHAPLNDDPSGHLYELQVIYRRGKMVKPYVINMDETLLNTTDARLIAE